MATANDDVKKEVTSTDDQKIEHLAEKPENSSGELEAQYTELDEREAQRVLRKVDYRLVPMLALLYLVAFIDRSNSTSIALRLFRPCVVRGYADDML